MVLGTGFKGFFGMQKSSDVIGKLLKSYLEGKISLSEFLTQYNTKIDSMKNPEQIIGGVNRVSNIYNRMEYLITKVGAPGIIFNFLSENVVNNNQIVCQTGQLDTLENLRAIPADQPGGELGVIFNKFLDLMVSRDKRFTSLYLCLSPSKNVERNTVLDDNFNKYLVPFSEKYSIDGFFEPPTTPTFRNAYGGRRTRRRKSRGRKSRRTRFTS